MFESQPMCVDDNKLGGEKNHYILTQAGTVLKSFKQS